MIEKVTLNDFINAFKDCFRYNDYGSDGLKALFEYLEDVEAQTGEQMELDASQLYCEYRFYDTLQEFHRDYEGKYTCIEEIARDMVVIPVDGISFIVKH